MDSNMNSAKNSSIVNVVGARASQKRRRSNFNIARLSLVLLVCLAKYTFSSDTPGKGPCSYMDLGELFPG